MKFRLPLQRSLGCSKIVLTGGEWLKTNICPVNGCMWEISALSHNKYIPWSIDSHEANIA